VSRSVQNPRHAPHGEAKQESRPIPEQDFCELASNRVECASQPKENIADERVVFAGWVHPPGEPGARRERHDMQRFNDGPKRFWPIPTKAPRARTC